MGVFLSCQYHTCPVYAFKGPVPPVFSGRRVLFPTDASVARNPGPTGGGSCERAPGSAPVFLLLRLLPGWPASCKRTGCFETGRRGEGDSESSNCPPRPRCRRAGGDPRADLPSALHHEARQHGAGAAHCSQDRLRRRRGHPRGFRARPWRWLPGDAPGTARVTANGVHVCNNCAPWPPVRPEKPQFGEQNRT